MMQPRYVYQMCAPFQNASPDTDGPIPTLIKKMTSVRATGRVIAANRAAFHLLPTSPSTRASLLEVTFFNNIFHIYNLAPLCLKLSPALYIPRFCLHSHTPDHAHPAHLLRFPHPRPHCRPLHRRHRPPDRFHRPHPPGLSAPPSR